MSSQISLARTILSRPHRAKAILLLRPIGLRCQSTLTPPPSTAASKWQRPLGWAIAGALVAVTALGSSRLPSKTSATTTSLDAFGTIPLLGPSIEESLVEDPKDTSLIEEPETGISFPAVFESKSLFGLGVRKKYQILNVYVVGCYANREDFRGINNNDHEEQEAALLDPHKHKTLRIVMNRELTMETIISALLEAIEPRMHGKELWALDHFSKLRNYGCLVKGEEIILTIRGGVIECRCSNGGKSIVHSEVFTRAVCDVYFGKDPISPAAKAAVLAGMRDL